MAKLMLLAIRKTKAANGDAGIRTAPLLELNLRGRLRTLICGEFRHRLFTGECCLGPDNGWEGAQRCVVGPHRVDIVASRYGNAVLGALEL